MSDQHDPQGYDGGSEGLPGEPRAGDRHVDEVPEHDVFPPAPDMPARELAGAPGDGGRAGRRRAAEAAARAQATQSRRRALVLSGAVLGVLVLVGAVVGGWALLHRSSGTTPVPDPTPSPTSTKIAQPTMLIQIKTSDGVAVDNALTSVGGTTDRANMITVPPETLLDVATGGTLPLGEIARLPDVNGSANALSDAIGVNIDATWVMDTLAFSGLVDSVGGIVTDVTVDVLVTGPDGKTAVLVPAGPHQLLQGPQAAAYATYLAPGEPETARMARFQTILSLTLAKLPPDASKIEQIITALGASAKTTVPASQVATYLVKMRAALLSEEITFTTMPVSAVDVSATGATAYRINTAKATAMVDELLPGAKRVPGPNSKVRVLVENGVGTPGLNTAARQQLVDAGFTYVNGGNAPKFGVRTTQIVLPDNSAEARRWGTDIATALKVPASDIVINADGQSLADVIVVLGADYTPPAP